MVYTPEGSKDELACTLAAMILHDGKVEITEASLNAVTAAASVTVEPTYSKGFASALSQVDVSKYLVVGVGGGGGGAPAAAGGAAPAAGGEKAAEKAKEPEPEEEEAVDLGFSLFD